MIPFGWLAIKSSVHVLRVPRTILMPIVLMFCIVGAFAINNSPFAVLIMLVFGVSALSWRRTDFRSRPAILGMVLGPMLEENFFTSMIKSDGNSWRSSASDSRHSASSRSRSGSEWSGSSGRGARVPAPGGPSRQ